MMATRIFCDLCNKLIPSTPPKEITAVAVIPAPDPYGDSLPRTTEPRAITNIKVTINQELCEECKSKMLRHLQTQAEYNESKIHRFGEKK